MKLATRFVVPIAGLGLLAGMIVWPRWLVPERNDPCAHPDVLDVTGLIPGSRSEGERDERLSEDVVQWSEGTVGDPALPEQPLHFWIVRSYAVLDAAERPPQLLSERLEPEEIELVWVDAPGARLPVHVVRSTGEPFQLAAYLYVLGNEPVQHPFIEQLRGAIQELREGRRPLTVLLAGGPANGDTETARRNLAVSWVVNAWAHFRAMCIERKKSLARPGSASR